MNDAPNEYELKMIAIVKMICDNMTNLELSAINLAVQLDMDPRDRLGYEKAKYLFTENNGMRMHAAYKDILAKIVLQRFGKGN